MMNTYKVDSADTHQPLITLVENPKPTISILVEMYGHKSQSYISYSIKVQINNDEVYYYYYNYYSQQFN